MACAFSGTPLARVGSQLETGAMAAHARRVGGPALRAMTFHARARMLKALAIYLNERKGPLYTLSHHTGATQTDNLIDIDGGIGTAVRLCLEGTARKCPTPASTLTGGPEALARDGSFIGQHVCVPKTGVALHINAYNFPVWGMLEKLAPTLLAGMPCHRQTGDGLSLPDRSLFPPDHRKRHSA